ncbi:MAG TPA: chromosome partitioning protein ParA, partial [Erythrobacter sp.]|nr:chromosome partitioning protein ParA [Erythrobacter sp.]
GLGVAGADREYTSYDLLLDQGTLSECAQPTDIPGLDIVPATQDLSGAEVELVSVDDRTARLRKALDTQGYDVCFIDCPPSLGLLTLNALCAADSLLVPLQCEFFALEGLSQLLQTVERVQQGFNSDLGIIGVVLTMFDRRNRLTDQVADDVRDCLGKLVFENVIPRNVRLSEAPSHGMPALVYDHNCSGSRAYIGLARELIGRLPQKRKAA